MKNLVRLVTATFLSSTARDTYVIFSGNIFSSFLAFLYTLILVRVFSPQNLGVFSAVTAFILLVSDVLDLGITTSLSRFYPDIKKKEGQKRADFFIKNTFFFKLLISLSLTLAIVFLSPLLSRYLLKNPLYSRLFVLSAVGILTTSLTAFSVAALSARKHFLPVAVISSFSTLGKLILVVILYFYKLFSLELVTASFAVAPLFAFFLSLKFINLNLSNISLNIKFLKKLLSYSVFIAAARVFSAVTSRLDALMLIPLSSSYEAGIYSASYKIIFIYILLSGSFSMVIAPRLSSFASYQESFPYFKKIFLGVFLILLSMSFMFLVAPAFVPFVLGRSYQSSVPVFQALLLPMALFVSTLPAVNFLLYVAKKPQISAFNTFIQIFIIVIGNWYFIPRYGRFGPVFTLSLAYGFTLLSSLFFALYYFKHE